METKNNQREVMFMVFPRKKLEMNSPYITFLVGGGGFPHHFLGVPGDHPKKLDPQSIAVAANLS